MRAPVAHPSVKDEARRRLSGRTGRRFWRALDALTAEPSFEAAVAAEFPSAFAEVDGPARRQVLKAMAASMGLAGLAACSDQPDDQALPYVRQPEFMVADQARHYATAVTTVGGYAQPVLGTTYAGRPTKLEGLDGHPASQGAADAFTQATLLGLYDPDRSQTPRLNGWPADWSVFDAAMVAGARRFDTNEGEGLRLLVGQSTSPTLARQLDQLTKRWPKARWHRLEPVDHDGARLAAAAAAFGRPLQVLPRLDLAEVVVCLDDDPLGPGAAQTRNARRWSTRRLAFQRGEGASRLFVAEPTPSLAGAMAEERVVVDHSRIGLVAQALAASLGAAAAPTGLDPRERAWVARAAAALKQAGAKACLLVGPGQPAAVQALGLQLNGRLGAFGQTVRLIEPVALQPPDGVGSFDRLVADMAAGRVDTLVMLETNPVYAAPADSGFTGALKKVRLPIHFGLTVDETARRCPWHAPVQHDLETWSDARSVDGMVSLIQPLVRPFYAVRSRHALIEAVQGRAGADARETVAATWREAWGGDFDTRWAASLRAGFVDGSAAMEVEAAPGAGVSAIATPAADGLELLFRPDPTIWDGRFANNPWLQELPKPLNKMTWDNVLAVSPALARERGLTTGDVVEISAGGRKLRAPVWVTPGQARRTLTAFLGYGRRIGDQVGDGHGYDAYPLRTRAAPWAATGVTLAKTGERAKLASTQEHQALEGHDFVRTVTADAARKPKPAKPREVSFYKDVPVDRPAWGMSIDTDLCIGCNACVTACDAENNIAMVGKDQVAQGREMHWLRIDHYFEGDADAPSEFLQPVPCMHCEQAPCELGCPVNATVHSPDGLNLQVYNRCIGTRTCSSYCPYKVRRFNWFHWTQHDPPEHQAQRNPNVTVRSRGVMEKCTYCIQRISAARIKAKLENRPVREGEVRTACQQTCPTEAIVFGDVLDPESAVSKRKATARDYTLAEEANTRPRTTYLAKIGGGGGGEDGEGG